MALDRKGLLKAGCLGLAGLAIPSFSLSTQLYEQPHWVCFHPTTQGLIERAQRSNAYPGQIDICKIESLIREEAMSQGWIKSPVIKWRASSSDAVDHLKCHGLNALLKVRDARMWRRAGQSSGDDDDRSETATVLGEKILRIVRAGDLTDT